MADERAEPDPRAQPPVGEVRPVDLRDYTDFDQDRASRVRVLATERLATELWCIEPQQATSVLCYDGADVTYTVLGGHSWFVTDQGEIGLEPMGAILVPAGVVHGIDNRAADPLIVLASMAEPGEAPEQPPVADEQAAIRDDEAGIGRRLRRGLGRVLGE